MIIPCRVSLALSLLAVLLGLETSSVWATEPIRFARQPAISPDGKLIAFSYLGDIWVADAVGGTARPVTMHQAHDMLPAFSPDGRWIAFSSNRHGSYDVFVVPVQGGRPTRLTFDSGHEYVNGWSPDSRFILFTAANTTAFPATQELYTVPLEGGRRQRLSAWEGREGAFSPRGDQLAYVRGPGTWYRKGYRGSSNDDIWICQADGTGNRRLTTFNGQDTSPTWSLDGRFLYYVSEYFGTPANIVKQEATGSSPPRPFTFHKDEAVRQARISANGEWIVYECGPDLWLTSTHEGAAPRRLAIEVHADDKTNPEEIRTFTNGASEYVLSPDEKHVIFALHGSLFLMPIELPGKPRRLTTTAASDHSVAWAPDGQKIAFLSDRNGHDNIYLLQPDDPVRPRLVGAQHFKVKQLTRTPELEQGLSFTPDGRRLAFLRSGQLWTMNFDGTDARVLVADKQVVDYEYTSDGRWLAYARMDGSFATEIYVMPAGGGPARNVSRYATHNSGLTWSRDGSKLAFISERRSSPSLYVMSMHKPPVTPGAGSGDIDWEDIHLRVTQPATRPVTSGAISPDGSRVAFRSSDRDGDDLWVASVTGGQLSRLTTGNLQPQQIEWSRRDPSLIYFRDNAGALRKVRTPQGSVESLPFNVKMTICREEEFTEMFDQSWRGLAENFYDPHYHGADWDAVRARYRPLVKHVALKEDLYALISLMMGELNASHLGITGPVPKAEEETADLGLVFDETWRGPGVKIAAVVKRGPADRHGLDLRPGEYITAVDGTRLTERVNLSKLLNDKAGETVRVEVSRNASADPRDVKAVRSAEIRAVSREALRRSITSAGWKPMPAAWPS